MKLIKALAFTAFAAIAAMGIIGTSSAMATSTQVCQVHQEPCQNAVGTSTFHLATSIWLLAGWGGSGIDILCLALLMEEVKYSSLGQPQSVQIAAPSFSNCGTEGSGGSHSNCTKVEALNTPWTAEVLKTDLNLGGLEIRTPEAKVFFKCTIFGFVKVECEFNYYQAGFHFHGAGGGRNGLLLMEGVLLVPSPEGSSLCPEEAEITTGILEPLAPSYIVG